MNAPGTENVVLVGFMGSGKSSVGRLVARTLRARFVDTDRLVIDREGCDITEIFAKDGEAYFRQQESRALESLLGQRSLTIATGGGIVTAQPNLQTLRKLGLVVWLTATEEVIWDRVSRNQKRPLLHTPDPRETVRTLLEKRNPLYQEVADMEIDTTLLSHAEVAQRICERVIRTSG